MVEINKFVDCSWFADKLLDSALEDESQAFVDNLEERFIARYYTARYVLNVEGIDRNDYYILNHANGIAVIGLARSHLVFEDSDNPVQGIDFKLDSGRNLLANNVKGKKKQGAVRFKQANQLLGHVVMEDGGRIPIHCPIEGQVVEVNNRLNIHDKERMTLSMNPESYLIVVLPKLFREPLPTRFPSIPMCDYQELIQKRALNEYVI